MNPSAQPVPDLPTQMRHIGVAEPGGPEVLRIQTGPIPQPRSDEVLIKVAASGVNRPDVQQRKGLYPPPPGASLILGLEVAGEIVAVGSAVPSFAVGDRVTALCNGGGYAEYVAVPALQCLPVPSGLSMLEAASLPETTFTVWANLFDLGRLKPGETVLVHGGTSGIGVTATQLGAAFGARVLVTAGSEQKCAAALELGAQGAINYRNEDFLDAVRRLTDGAGVDIVLDMVGAPYFTRNLRALKRDGRLIEIAFMHGTVAEKLDLLPIMMKRLTITGSTMRPRTTAEKGTIATALRETVWPWYENKRIRPVIHSRFPLARAAEAHALMESSAHIGKIVLEII